MVDLSNLRVALLAGTLGQGGAERQLFYLARALRWSGAEVSVLSLGQSEFWESRIISLGVSVTWVGHSGSRWKRLAAIVSELRKTVPHIVQSQHFYANLYAGLAARICRLREIGAIRNAVQSEIRATGPLSGRACLRLPRLIAANSRAAIEGAIAMGVRPSRLFLLPNVVDTDQFSPKRGEERDAVRLLAVGRLVPQKRFDRFLRLLARLSNVSGLRVSGTVVGSGPLEAALRRQAVALQLSSGTIEFRPATPEMYEIYRAADLLVLCSDFEGTPNVILEAMASGLPVVAMAVGGVPDVVRDGETGLIVMPEDEDGLFRSVAALAADLDLRIRMAERGREHVVAHFSCRLLPEALRELYRSAVA